MTISVEVAVEEVLVVRDPIAERAEPVQVVVQFAALYWASEGLNECVTPQSPVIVLRGHGDPERQHQLGDDRVWCDCCRRVALPETVNGLFYA